MTRRVGGRAEQVLDLIDPVHLGRMRSRATAGLLLAGVLVGVLGWVTDPADPLELGGPLLVVLVVAFAATAGAVLVAGPRFGDGWFLAVLLATVSGVVATSLLVDGPRRGLSTDTLLLGPLALAAVFSRSRWVAAVVTAAACAGSVVLAVAAQPRMAVPQVVFSVTAILSVVVLVSMLREVAFTAIVEARARGVRDHLTGLFNRHGVEEAGGHLWNRAAANARPLAVALVDIDHFKVVNDTFGHAAGDELLTHVAARLSGYTGRAGVLARWGGEEYLLLVPVPAGGSPALAEQVRLAVRHTWVAPVTVSVGVHEVVPGPDDELPEALWRAIETADVALYAAKRSGRDQVSAAS